MWTFWWQTVATSALFWVVPTVGAIVFSRKTLKRIETLLHRHVQAQEQIATQLKLSNARPPDKDPE